MSHRASRLSSHPMGRWWWSIDKPVLLTTVILMLCGLLAVALASSAVMDTYDVDAFYFFRRQFMFILLAIPCILALSTFSPTGIQRLAVVMLVGCAIGIVLTLLLGQDVKGARRWVYFAGVSLQPTEFLKPALVVFTAWMLSFTREEERARRFFTSLGVLGFLVLLMFLQPDFGMILMHSIVWGTQVFLSGMPLVWLALLACAGLLLGASGYLILPHVRSRVERFLDPSSGDSYQVDQAREALLSGGLFGRGAGEGVVKFHLPDAHTDFILAVIGEEFGLLACVVLLCLYLTVLVRGYRALMEKEDRFVILAGSGLLSIFALQVLVNTGVVLNVIPTTGMTLPFISYGGSGTLSMAITVGFLMALMRKRGDDVVRKRSK